MQIGDKVWIFDSNNRVCQDDNGNKLDRCRYRGHFRNDYDKLRKIEEILLSDNKEDNWHAT